MVSTVLSAGICFAFWLPSAYVSSKFGLLVFFSIASGTVSGVFWCTIAAVATEVVGLQILPSALSMIWLSIVPSTMFAEPMALSCRRYTSGDSFIPAQIFISATFAAAVIPIWVMRGWKAADTDRRAASDTTVCDKQGEKVGGTHSTEQTASINGAGSWRMKDVAGGMLVWKRI